MAAETKIAWAKSTFNPWIGCTKVSPDCDACYAEAHDRRWHGGIHWGQGAGRHHTSLKYWNEPIKWNTQATMTREFWPVFGGSMCDVFDNEVPGSWRDDYWKLIEQTPALTWLLVTKRVGNVLKMVPQYWRRSAFPQNVWILMSAGAQDLFDRDWQRLAEIPARVRGVSIEPMRGPVIMPPQAYQQIHWAIYGGESRQPDRYPRECKVEWIEAGIANCRELGVAPFVKQMGHYTSHNGKRVIFGDKGDDIRDFPASVRVQEWPHNRRPGNV